LSELHCIQTPLLGLNPGQDISYLSDEDITPYGLVKVNFSCCLLRADFLPDLLFDPEDRGNFLRYVM
jgi:hypothetical protein